MKLISWIKNAINSVKTFFCNAGKKSGDVITSTYDSLNKVGKVIIPIADNIMQKLKTFVDGNLDDEIVAIIKTFAPTKVGVIAELVDDWLEKNIPIISLNLNIFKEIDALSTMAEKVAFINTYFKNIAGDNPKALIDLSTLTLNLTVYLADGELDKTEKSLLKAAIKEYYNAYIKNK
jgi:hypothetical protein